VHGRREEDPRVDGVRDHDRLPELEAELAVLLQAEPRLEDGGVGQLQVDRCDAGVRAVVEAPVDADRAVDAVHHPAAATGEPPQTAEIEVEGVEEARRRTPREAVDLDGHSPAA
jgi:hypothetical protein